MAVPGRAIRIAALRTRNVIAVCGPTLITCPEKPVASTGAEKR